MSQYNPLILHWDSNNEYNLLSIKALPSLTHFQPYQPSKLPS